MALKTWSATVCLAASLLSGGSADAADVAKLLFSQGMVSVKAADGTVRIVAKGSPLAEGDTVSTVGKGFAVIEYLDGGKTTLRPDTTLTIKQYAPAAVVHTLVQGGLRSVTGAIGKANPAAVKYHAGTATLGIRGTTFDARLCQAGDCASEAAGVIARAIFVRGEVQAGGRVLSKGGGVAVGDTVQTSPGAVAVLAFADGSKASLGPGSRFVVKDWLYQQGEAGRAMLQLVKGAVRVATGAIGKQNPAGYKMQVATAVIGVRGTGFDVDCQAQCADAADSKANEASADPLSMRPDARLYTYVWQGAIDVSGSKFNQAVATGQVMAVQLADGKLQFLPSVPAFMPGDEVPRPDQVPGEFGDASPELKPGLYTWVRTGLVTLEQDGSTVTVLPGESGFADQAGKAPLLLPVVPAVLADDATPYPEHFDPLTAVLHVRSQVRNSFITPPAQCTIR